MYKTILLISLFLLLSCDRECTEPIGNIVSKEIEVTNFEEIIAKVGVQLIIKESNEQKVVIETGENRLDNIDIFVHDKILELEASSTCTLQPSYEAVKVYINTPILKKIRNSSEYTIVSDGVLHFPKLVLLSEDHKNDYNNIGDFDLKIDNETIDVVSNGLSKIQVIGKTTNLNLSYYAGFGRFDGKDLIAQKVAFYHKGENSLVVNPQQSLTGNLYSTGDVISFNHPEIVEVTEYFFGKLIYKP